MAGLDVHDRRTWTFPDVREVDLKLIELARTLQGKIVTNDFNLNKVAQLRGVDVLNINELANSLKPVVLPGEIMKVFILKEGKEYNQGVAYLDDGTMVVVDNARKMIGKTIDIVVTSVLQTTAGKMIFGRFIDPSVAAAQAAHGRAERDRAASRERRAAAADAARLGSARPAPPASADRAHADAPIARVPPFHWWRTVFFLIPAIAVYTIVLGTLSLVSSLFDRRGYFAHWCARTWSWLILATTGVRVDVDGPRAARRPARTYVFVVESPEHLRHPGALLRRCRFSCGSSRRSRSARFRSSAGTCGGPDTCWSIAGIPTAPASSAWRDARRRGPVADHLSRGHAQPRRPRGPRSRRAASCWRSKRGCRSSRCRSSAAAT